eukprot:9620644-Alexandrium_andersonii.AAC.1
MVEGRIEIIANFLHNPPRPCLRNAQLVMRKHAQQERKPLSVICLELEHATHVSFGRLHVGQDAVPLVRAQDSVPKLVRNALHGKPPNTFKGYVQMVTCCKLWPPLPPHRA